jgi:hypothetical protein
MTDINHGGTMTDVPTGPRIWQTRTGLLAAFFAAAAVVTPNQSSHAISQFDIGDTSPQCNPRDSLQTRPHVNRSAARSAPLTTPSLLKSTSVNCFRGPHCASRIPKSAPSAVTFTTISQSQTQTVFCPLSSQSPATFGAGKFLHRVVSAMAIEGPPPRCYLR